MSPSWKFSFLALYFMYFVAQNEIRKCSCARKFTEKDILYYRNRVNNMFQHAYNGYLNYAFPYDELRPLTCDGQDTWGSYSLTLIDALDTLAVMGNYSEFRRVANLVSENSDFDRDINVSVFESNIRVVGGLLSAHLMSKRAGVELEPGWPCSGPLLRLAENLARKLLPAFNTSTGMPYGTVNLRYGVPTGETPVTCTAGVGTFILEFGALTRLTGDPVFENTAMKALKALWESRSSIGLVGNHIDVLTGKWTALDAGIGAGVDSYFEYMVKGSILFNYPELLDKYRDHMTSIEQYMKREDWYMWVHMQKGTVTLPVFQSLEAFIPGVQSLLGDIDLGMKTLHNYHQVWRQFGFTPEFYNIVKAEAQSNREGYPLRPELIESVMYLYRATKDPYLLEVGVDILESIDHSARTSCGYATVKDVKDHKLENRMESFFLAETTKYLYLLFDTDNFLHNTGDHGTTINTTNGECTIETGNYVFNTEAHPFDGAALYCCSAEKKKHDKELQDFHDSVDLLALLGLAEPQNDMFTSDLHVGEVPVSSEEHNSLSEAGASEPAASLPTQSSSSSSSSSSQEGDIHTEDVASSLDMQEVLDSVEPVVKEAKLTISKPQEPNRERNIAKDTETVQDSQSENDASKLMEEITEININDKILLLGPKKVFLNNTPSQMVNNPAEPNHEVEDDPVCLPQDRFKEELEAKQAERQEQRRLQQLLTCPAQPFHLRLSVLGEMFPDD